MIAHIHKSALSLGGGTLHRYLGATLVHSSKRGWPGFGL